MFPLSRAFFRINVVFAFFTLEPLCTLVDDISFLVIKLFSCLFLCYDKHVIPMRDAVAARILPIRE